MLLDVSLWIYLSCLLLFNALNYSFYERQVSLIIGLSLLITYCILVISNKLLTWTFSLVAFLFCDGPAAQENIGHVGHRVGGVQLGFSSCAGGRCSAMVRATETGPRPTWSLTTF